jgi:hypothetical protein
MINIDLNKALCKKRGMSTSMFFEDFENMTSKNKIAVLAICNKCEIKKQCREAGLEQRDCYGVWGGSFFKKGREVKNPTVTK